jgi:TatD DNase family protein
MIDFHCHLDLYPDALRIVDQVSVRNRFTLAVTTSPRAWQTTSQLFDRYPNIKVALGLHPEIVVQKEVERGLLISFVSQAAFIGEVGLDGSIQHRHSLELQESILKAVLDECEQCGGRILSIHSRNAVGLVLDCIEQHCQLSIPVLHWFSGTLEETRRAVNMGCWFSVGPAMLRGAKGQRIIKELPKEKVLPETDGPFVRNGSSPLMPWEAITIVKPVAIAWNMAESGVTEQLNLNLMTLLNTMDLVI